MISNSFERGKNLMKDCVKVIGAGLAGCEAAWQIANRGIFVKLYEMKPNKKSPAHHRETFAELVCSNSLRSNQLENAVGLLKEEMRMLNSIIMEAADNTKVPAGGALAVDRDKFSDYITDKIRNHPNIEIVHQEVCDIDLDEYVVVATGPLTSEKLFDGLKKILGEDYLHFFDAAAPIVYLDSVDQEKAFKASRYNKGSDDYINCSMNKQEYDEFVNNLIHAELAEVKHFEKEVVFEGCMPIETMAKRGYDTIRFGPLKPVGLINPRTGAEDYAVVQLRQDNSDKTLYNIVGFQTRLKWGEQKRVFGLIPALKNAKYARYGVMHRNTFINSPKLLSDVYSLRDRENIFFAGQITGVEGYIESASSGLVAGINIARKYRDKDKIVFPKTTAIGALALYVSNNTIKNFQPMNINFGLMDQLKEKIKDKKIKNQKIAMLAIEELVKIKEKYDL